MGLTVLNFDKDSHIDMLHDVLVEVNGRSYSERQLRQIFEALPHDLKVNALLWEFDTVTRDEIYTHLKRHGVPTV